MAGPLSEHERRTVEALSEWLLPADERSGGGIAAGVAEFVDYLARHEAFIPRWLLAQIGGGFDTTIRGGLAWLDAAMRRRAGTSFVDACRDRQRAMLDALAWPDAGPDAPAAGLGPGIRMLAGLRLLALCAFYTSREGLRDLGYAGSRERESFDGCGEAVNRELLRRVDALLAAGGGDGHGG